MNPVLFRSRPGESLWSKGQKDAVVHLVGYAASHDEADFERFRAALRMPLGDRVARLELDRPEPDLERARQGLLDFMAEAIETWREADEQIAALDELAGRIRRTVRAGPQAAAAGGALPALMAELGRQNDRLTLLERRFSERLGAASRQAGRLVLAATLLLGLALAAAAVALSLRTLRRRVRAEQALRASEERLQRALDASGLALWDYDVPSGEVYLSESWAQALGGAPAVTRTTFAELTALVPDSDCPALQQSLVAALKDPGAVYRRRDGGWLWNLSEGRVVERDAEGRARCG